MIEDNIEVSNNLLCFVIGNVLEEPFTGIQVGCSWRIIVPSSHPEANFLICTRVGTIVTPRRIVVCLRIVTILMEIITLSGFASKTDTEDFSIISFAIQFCVIPTCIVEYNMTCIGLVLSHNDSTLTR